MCASACAVLVTLIWSTTLARALYSTEISPGETNLEAKNPKKILIIF